jgi:hypothetical protein
MLGGHVGGVQRVLATIEELELGTVRGAGHVVGELPPVEAQRVGLLRRGHAGIGPARGLRDGRPGPSRTRTRAAPHEGGEAGALDPLGRGQTAQLEQGRHHVDELDRLRHARARGNAPRPPEEQRNVRQLTVDALVVEGAAVLEELLTMIGEESDQRAPARPSSPSRSRRRPIPASIARMEPS